MQYPLDQTASRTSRLTENKRRYRTRRKEYVIDLEQRLEEARECGVQATKEVQLAAQQVIQENARLRELLGLAGFSHEDVDAWAKPGDSGGRGNAESCARRRNCEEKARNYASKRTKVEAASGSSGSHRKTICEASGTQMPDVPELTHAANTSSSIGDEGPHTSTDSPSQSGESCRPAASPLGDALLAASSKPPCKLLSRLAENPGADLTQTAAHPAADNFIPAAGGDGEGVECAKAYEMLMRFATSEEKIDDVAGALENGCTSNGQGGCAVKKKVIWQALDGMVG